MSTLRDLAEEHTLLRRADIDHLHRIAGDWQLLSDLSFADLLLWVPVDDEGSFLCVAQVRPTTAPTAYQDDQVGRIVGGPEVAHLEVAYRQGRIWREGDPVWYGDVPARHEAIPVRLRTADGESGEVIAVVGRDTNLSTARTPSQLELNYLTTADDLAQMIADGTFPPPRHPGETTSAPRVGDGLVRLDAGGKVTYASPNAQSAYRRLGHASHLVGEDLAVLHRRLAGDPLEGTDAANGILAALRGEAPPRREIDARGATMLTRALPLMPAGVPIGALVLVRDITEVRRRDRALITKDATIREIHHRVKNNLQTVAALLRLQARRVSMPEARVALEESVRRVASIALVHETLSMSSDEVVEFDGIVDRVANAATEVAATEVTVGMRRKGTFGVLPAEIATSLVMVLNELLLNAVEHGFPPAAEDLTPGTVPAAGSVPAAGPAAAGSVPAADLGPAATGEGERTAVPEVVVSAHRFRKMLHVTVADNGRGLPAGFDAEGDGKLGLQIVRALVTGELRGSIELRPGADGGTEAFLAVPLARTATPDGRSAV
ncbi:Two-component sensor histidine kinase, contains HisKA and HATPase domains [Micromonospora phaseoli]|uniref:histidine kinase n=1 Tax=Micromonospora phaseoli TaxID=1144548 RepID=A0A1H6WL83_9ACTN|nr:PAS domain-containing sensor histidine kinase [Micromonospora phaseoli]PZW01859.1 two-component sensor histidine kinase [Micromonospora phaseoli]GIJ78243.1 ATPase [Micromonospora phaseoli]SEJ17633.1 Two-component sensor histidine kinase, contains HisKA and HATPase domains [Micromonospora phaseoli]